MSHTETATRMPVFAFPARVYYEDTDAAGVVYYANYLKFFERCRTEWIRSLGYDQSELAARHGIAFVVRRVDTDYRRPARLDDLLSIELAIEKLSPVRFIFRQVAIKLTGGVREELVSARVELACVDPATMKPTPVPDWLREQLNASLEDAR